MGRWAVVREATGDVENVIKWDGVAPWKPPDGCVVYNVDNKAVPVGPGDGYDKDKKEFFKKEPKPHEVKLSVEEQLANLKALVEAQAAEIADLKTKVK